MDATTPYQRSQRRRALVGWSTLGVIVVLIIIAIVFGGDRQDSTVGAPPQINIFTWEMSSVQYQEIHKGEEEALVDRRLGSSGLGEDEVEDSDVLRLFPPPPTGTTCSFWKLSDAPDHLVRLCFSDPERVLLQKAVRAPGEGGAETTLA